MRNNDLKPETLAAQAMGYVDETTGAVTPPIHLATTYERAPDNSYPKGYVYTRSENPTYGLAEDLLARLENGAGALIFSAGMSAAVAPFMTLRPGDHVVAPTVMYWALRNWLLDFTAQWGIGLDFFDVNEPESAADLVQEGKTKIVWIETPANPLWDCLDIAWFAQLAHGAGARLCVDSTAATPVITRPIEHGADLVMHSATKYLNGHSDVLGGALIAAKADDWWGEIRRVRTDHGMVMGPFEAWLLLRGMRTLHLRVRKASENAQAIAEHFHNHPKIGSVLYPGLPTHIGHDVALRQMEGGFGGMLSLRIAGGEAAAVKVAANLEVIHRATSLGGVESLVEHRASIEGKGTPVPDDLLRFSIGIEDLGDLIQDLEQALNTL
ncbi:aminotransferase class I/II-fold pyridoxal phosphate-dependent enzyme [Nisaea acidiphila]|uniref:Aminotransferase class I/II-fold pyridoxal phosphate-dependent enzyme n=1 Tax=Nisaea acidiphila TaxID=1862145 RepID=A0A9J7AR80_9PROT|nr:aminotransferase class I/II-fold pyridoxal phosphate-dependent enzyme [Nisaea acidiphila]UUX49880.1 aminotransferase class I/II-fold pyridoxal phosphate-dependent enzyme [Nisaea acidiphila]